MSTIHKFLPSTENGQTEIDDGYLPNNRKENDGTCTRFIRKKYNCIMFFLGVLLVFIQTSHLFVEKIDDQELNGFVRQLTRAARKISNLSQTVAANETEGNQTAPEYEDN